MNIILNYKINPLMYILFNQIDFSGYEREDNNASIKRAII